MGTLLFFDDWCLESYQNIERKMGKPKWVEEATFADPHYERSCYYPSVFWDPALARWRAFYIAWARGQEHELRSLATAESDDGIHWETPDLEQRFPNQGRIRPNQIFQAGAGTEPGCVYLDERETDRTRRYKLLYLPGSYKEYVAGTGHHRLAASTDGYQWQPVEGVSWGDWLTDTPNLIYYNQHRDSYVTVCRPKWGDRRVSLVETRDWHHWSKPEVVVHPDPLDPPMLQFYSMPVFPYEGMYIGLLWVFHTDPQEVRGDKRAGPIDCQLTYSYDGWHFNRAFREAFIPLNDPGLPGCGSVYPSTICVDKDNTIRVYSNGWDTEHHYPREKRHFTLMLYTLRLDGFMYLESTAALGRVMTRCLLFDEPVLKINVQAPVGDVQAQISDETGKPFEGLTFEDCLPFRGDALFWEPAWRNGKSLRDVLGRVVRVEVQMYRGRLYALRGGFKQADLMTRMRLRKADTT